MTSNLFLWLSCHVVVNTNFITEYRRVGLVPALYTLFKDAQSIHIPQPPLQESKQEICNQIASTSIPYIRLGTIVERFISLLFRMKK